VHVRVGPCECAEFEIKGQYRYKVNSVRVAILLAIYQLYCLGIEAVQEPVGVRLVAPVTLAVQQQIK
jgi:hypothetical protein